MRPKEMIVEITPADLAPWNGAPAPVRFVWTETSILVRFDPPPETATFMERLRRDFTAIESQLTGQSLEIMRFLVDAPIGQTRREQLMDAIWLDKIPTFGRVRNAIHVLNDKLEELQFAYVVSNSRRGVIKIEPR